jgi:hypothetical protein
MRHTGVMRWDPDVDFSATVPSAARPALVRKISKFMGSDSTVHYSATRGLIQVANSAAHADLWLWTRDGVTGTWNNDDYTTKVRARATELIFPLQCDARWLSQKDVCLPNAPGELMRQEFGRDYMTPLVSHFECFENIWNGRLVGGGYLVAVLVSVYVILGWTVYTGGDLRHLCILMTVTLLTALLSAVAGAAVHYAL